MIAIVALFIYLFEYISVAPIYQSRVYPAVQPPSTVNSRSSQGMRLVKPPKMLRHLSDRFTGAVTYFKYKPGPVTVINSVWDGKSLKWIAFEGESLAGSFKMDGNAHLFCRLDPDVKTFFRTSVKSGVSQHWIVLHGRLLDTIMHLCSALDILFMRID